MAPACSSLPNPVFVGGSSAASAFLPRIAAELKQLSPPIHVIVQSSGSCTGVGYFTNDPPGKLTGTGKIYDAAAKEISGGCTLDDDTVDIGISDVWAETCPGGAALPANVKDTFGPVQTMTFVVPVASSQNIISAEAAYLVFGLTNGGVSPWTDRAYIHVRKPDSGTLQMIAANIKVPAGSFKGTVNDSGSVVLNMLKAVQFDNADKAIGIMATDLADINTQTVKVLGYQHYGQSCAYWPNSTATNFDKANVRDGHYPIWGPMHLLARTEGGEIANANVKRVVDYLSGAITPTGFDLINLEGNGGLVPMCAMKVTRSKDGGPMASYQPEKDCTCKFLNEVLGTPPSECKSCTADADCPQTRPHCNYKFCEVK